MTKADPSANPSVIADRIMRRWCEHSNAWHEPGHAGFVIMPRLLLEELGLPDCRFDRAAKVFEANLREALAASARQLRDHEGA